MNIGRKGYVMMLCVFKKVIMCYTPDIEWGFKEVSFLLLLFYIQHVNRGVVVFIFLYPTKRGPQTLFFLVSLTLVDPQQIFSIYY